MFKVGITVQTFGTTWNVEYKEMVGGAPVFEFSSHGKGKGIDRVTCTIGDFLDNFADASDADDLGESFTALLVAYAQMHGGDSW